LQAIEWSKLLPPVIFMALILTMFWFTVIRPAKKRQQDHVSLIDSVNEGDEIITVGGIYGKVTKVRDESFDLEVAPNLRLKFDRRAVRVRQADRTSD
jgi:preprotein translocase subunit YajC